MSISLDLPLELEGKLCTEAARLNLPLSEYILRVLMMRQVLSSSNITELSQGLLLHSLIHANPSLIYPSGLTRLKWCVTADC